MHEFSIIEKYFRPSSLSSNIELGIGDDCAIIKASPNSAIVSTDTLIEGVHFPVSTSASAIAHKALAVNLSDIAAMGGIPKFFTLSLALPSSIDEIWLEQFSSQLFSLARQYKVDLVGGDTCASSCLTISITIHGELEHLPMKRSNAQVGDIIVLSGHIGGAALGLQCKLENPEFCQNLTIEQQTQAIKSLEYPQAKLAQGQVLASFCDCAIDISDGLLADLGHILKQSACGAVIELDKLPLADCLNTLPKEQSLKMALTGGDDYELCACISKENFIHLDKSFIPIGYIQEQTGLHFSKNGKMIDYIGNTNLSNLKKGYEHFSNETKD